MHSLIFLFLNYSITPDTTPITTQEIKKSELNITPYDVNKSKPKELDNSGKEIASNLPATTQANQAAVKKTKAQQKAPTLKTLQAKDASQVSNQIKNKDLANQKLEGTKLKIKKLTPSRAQGTLVKANIKKITKGKSIPLDSKNTVQQSPLKSTKQMEIKVKADSAINVESKPEAVPQLQPNSESTLSEKLNPDRLLSSVPESELSKENMLEEMPSAKALEPEVQDVQIGSLKSNNVDETSISDFNEEAENLELPSLFAVAGLAWSGEEDNKSVDPVSLAAIQAFVQVGDLKNSNSNVGDVRDEITQTLGSIPCSRIQAQFIPESGSLRLNGHIPENGLREPILKIMQQQMGEDIKVIDNLLILPRPQCGIISSIKAVGLPQSTDQLTNPLLVGEDAHVKDYNYQEGERLKLDMIAPHYDSYIYVDYFDATGMVLHLQPNSIIPTEKQIANSKLSVGRELDGRPSLKIMIAPPFGQEIAVAFASSESLYDGIRPTIEPAQPYLSFLQDRINVAKKANKNFKGEWVYFFISTSQ